LSAVQAEGEPTQVLDAALLEALRTVLRHPNLDAAFKELVLTLPAETYIAEQLAVVDPQRIHAVREHWRALLAERLHDAWAAAWDRHQVTQGYAPTPAQSGPRALANLALKMLCLHAVRHGDATWPGRAYQRVKDGGNMSDRIHIIGGGLAGLSCGLELLRAGRSVTLLDRGRAGRGARGCNANPRRSARRRARALQRVQLSRRQGQARILGCRA
jgi:hypothetical protein